MAHGPDESDNKNTGIQLDGTLRDCNNWWDNAIYQNSLTTDEVWINSQGSRFSNAPKKEDATSDTKIFTGDDTNLDSSESEVCMGEACCSEGLMYDETLGQCVPQLDAFTNQSVANLVEPQPNEPSEFDKYTKYIK